MATLQKFYVPQVDERDCGVAALDMVCRFYGSDYILAHLRDVAQTDNDGTTALGIVKAANRLGFSTRAIKADMSLFEAADLPFPFIVHVLKEGKFLHYYTVFRATKDSIVLGDPDPLVGITKMSKERFAQEWDGIAIFAVPAPAYKPVKEDKGSLWGFAPLLLKQKKLVGQIVLAAILLTVISIGGSYFIQVMVDSYIPAAMVTTLSVVAGGLLIAYVFRSVFGFTQGFLLTVLGQRLTIDVTMAYVRHVFSLPMNFFATRRTGEIVSRFTDASKIIDALASLIVTVFLDVAMVLSVGIFLGVQNTRLFLISLVAVPIYVIIVLAFQKRFKTLNQATMEKNAILSSTVIEALDGIDTLKALTAEEKSYTKVDTEFAEFLDKSFAYAKSDQLQQALKTALKLVLNVVVLWVGAVLVIHNQLTLGQLFTYNALLAYFTDPLENIINLQPKLQMARVANNRLNEVLLVDSEFVKKRPIQDDAALAGPIKVTDVSFRYGFAPAVLNHVSLTIAPKSKLTIVGMSGSGKTTLAHLLTGYADLDSDQGTITINEHNINEVQLTTLRQHVVYVPQEAKLFAGTVMENLLMGAHHSVQPEEVDAACRLAQIKDDIDRLPLQYATDLSEDGSTLSGGQRQRLAIARALLTDAPVLIFDESTSNLDTITERKIVDALLALPDKTLIFIAHRLTIAKRTDNIVVLDHGQLVEQGHHDELMAKHGYYARLVNE
ncbi:peptide cleavage/export ABC transporter [Schleiferilactobacillus shenzhenensis]|uniref:PedD n=1 Tax=Schleiferilactobacillus shenzhenensis LY-73 TaxID=1231336 RepID=U4TRB7_9LACO|nr:peptide cleavage/export ABC transporter [Schleiferilactobacillus shenzhenensis]ERL66000.1 PedD [Schleiferilactobacillus shenzhenensis LY-73]